MTEEATSTQHMNISEFSDINEYTTSNQRPKEAEVNIGPVPFHDADPLGTSIVPSITQESQVNGEYQMRHLGSQAAVLVAPQDRIIAWNHLNTSMHILLSRSIILKALSLLIMSSNSSVNLVKRLDTMGLSDMSKIVKLMTVTAMNRVEMNSSQNQIEYSNLPFSLSKDFLQLATHVSLAARCCLNNLSIAITALPENDNESAKLVMEMCIKDLVMLSDGMFVPKSRFAVTQALVNILASHGGSSLMESTYGEAPLSPSTGMYNTVCFTIIYYIIIIIIKYLSLNLISNQTYEIIRMRNFMKNLVKWSN